jgi:AraC-like DNA-binding protein
LPLAVPPGTTKAWVTPRPPQIPRQLVIHGGFVVDDGRTRRLEHRARRLGFPDLRSYLQARCDIGHGVPRLARELGESEWTITQALTTLGVVLPPRPQRLALQRRRYAEQRIAARVTELGFVEVRAYLEDRLIDHQWLLVDVAAELAADRRTVRRLMQQAGVKRRRRTTRQLAVGERGRRVQAVSWQARRAARLAELGFADLAGYLQARYVEQRWPVKRMRAELGVGRNWLVDQMARLGLRR